MSRLFKFVGYSIGGCVALLLAAFTAVYFSSNAALRKTYVVQPREVTIPTGPAALAHGRHIAETRGCVDCHGLDLGGHKVIEDGAMGRIHGTNLTRGSGGRIASFRDEDWVRAIRHGVGADRLGLFLMPSEEYAHFSDEDLGALVAYLKTIPPVNRERVAIALGPVSRVLLALGKMKIAAAVIDHSAQRPPTVAPGATVEYGRYLAAGCTGCHGANYAGGKIGIGPPDWPHAANLTPHLDGRLGKWSEADFVKTLHTARRPDGSELSPVMPRSFGKMDDMELKALWAFFKTLPAVATGMR